MYMCVYVYVCMFVNIYIYIYTYVCINVRMICSYTVCIISNFYVVISYMNHVKDVFKFKNYL